MTSLTRRNDQNFFEGKSLVIGQSDGVKSYNSVTREMQLAIA